MAEDKNSSNIGLSTGRLEALSDGIFSIVVTLLVLFIEPPTDADENPLLDLLLSKWHVFAAYAFTFILIGIYWWRHHVIFHYIEKLDSILIWLNLTFLLVVAFVPFPTSLLIEYLDDPDEYIAGVLYGIVHMLCVLLLMAMWWYATWENRLVSDRLNPHIVRRFKLVLLLSLVIYILSIGLAFADIKLSLLIYVIIPLLSFLPMFRIAHETDLSKPS